MPVFLPAWLLPQKPVNLRRLEFLQTKSMPCGPWSIFPSDLQVMVLVFRGRLWTGTGQCRREDGRSGWCGLGSTEGWRTRPMPFVTPVTTGGSFKVVFCLPVQPVGNWLCLYLFRICWGRMSTKTPKHRYKCIECNQSKLQKKCSAYPFCSPSKTWILQV